MSALTPCRAACRQARVAMETAKVASTIVTRNRISHINAKLDELIEFLAEELMNETAGRDDFDRTFDKIEEHQAEGREVALARVNWDDEPSANEAWALMIYVCDACQHKERIWNARPHVTPFGGVPCPACNAHMTHAFFGSDEYALDHRPKKGDLIFIDLPPEIALIHAKRMIDRQAELRSDLPGVPEPEKLALNYLSDFGGHSPTAVRLLS